MSDTVRVQARTTATDFVVALDDPAGHHWQADEPAALGGGDTAPTPYQLALSALGACTAITLRMFAARKQWPLQDVAVQLALEPAASAGTGTDIVRRITLSGPLDTAQRERLLQIANACPIHRLLTGEVRIATDLVD